MLPILLFLLQPAVVPEAAALLQEAETEALKIVKPSDRTNALWTISGLYGRAGLIDDVARVVKRPGAPPGLRISLAGAQAVYGDPSASIAAFKANTLPPAEASGLWLTLANILWRAGHPQQAELALREGESVLRRILKPAVRKAHALQINILREALATPPPKPIVLPWQKEQPPVTLLPNDFPITVGGFGPPDPELTARRQAANSEYLGQLYAHVAIGNNRAAMLHVEKAPDSFSRTLGLATIQHLASQAGNIELAAQSVDRMSEEGDDCLLAKAEAFGALAATLRNLNKLDEAGRAMQIAFETAEKAKAPWGRGIVLAELGARSAELGFTASAADYFAAAIRAAESLPHDTERITRGIYRQNSRFRGELFGEIMPRMLRAKDYGAAMALARKWRQEGGPSYNGAIAGILERTKRWEEARAFARSLPTPKERSEQRSSLADSLLDEAGAPYF